MRPRRRPLVALAFWLALFVAGADVAGAATEETIQRLRDADCANLHYRVVSESSRTVAEQERALDGRFEISQTPPGEVVLRPPVDWTQDPFSSAGWRGDLHALKWLDVLFHIYAKSPDFSEEQKLQALLQARDLVLDWIGDNPVEGTFSDNKPWGPKVAGDRAPYIAFLVRALACEEGEVPPNGDDDQILNDDQASTLLDSVFTHGSYISEPGRYRGTNQGLFQDFGLILLGEYMAQVLPDASERWDTLGRTRFPNTLTARTSVAEGVYLEHSTNYQRLVANLLDDFLRFTGTGDPTSPRYNPFLVDLHARMQEATGWFVMPDGTFPQWGDSYLRAAPEWAKQRAADDDGLHVFPASGYAIVKRGGSFLGVTAGFHNQSHKHADDLSFDLFEGGHRIVSDTGLFHKDDGEFRAFEQEAQAHSTLTVKGRDFAIRDDQVYGSGIRATGTGGRWFAILGENPLLQDQGVIHTRLFLYRPGNVLIVLDRASADSRQRFTRFFHIGPDLAVSSGPTAYGLQATGFTGRLADADPKVRREEFFGQAAPLQGVTFPSFRQTVPRWSLALSSKRTDEFEDAATFSLASGKRFVAVPESLEEAEDGRSRRERRRRRFQKSGDHRLLLKLGRGRAERIVVSQVGTQLSVRSKRVRRKGDRDGGSDRRRDRRR